MGAKTAFSQGLGQGPAPIPRFHGGAQKGQLMGQGHMTSVLRGWAHLTFRDHCESPSPGGEGLHRGLGVRSEVGTYSTGCGRNSLALGLQGRALGEGIEAAAQKRLPGEDIFLGHTPFWNILKLDLKWLPLTT